MKIVVFDLDETLGYFTEFGVFIDSLKRYMESKKINFIMTQNEFNQLLELYPEFLRPNIINILNYLKHKKEKNICNKVMIYTNNQGSREWVNNIISYFENKINFKLIDQIICAFKINGKKIEICRTTNNKTYNDLIRCTKLPLDAEICFMDDNYYPGMSSDNVYYINIKPYYRFIEFKNMCNTFINSTIGKNILLDIDNKIEFVNYMLNEFKYYNLENIYKTEEEYNIDFILSKKIMAHLKIFFTKSTKNKTRVNTYKKYKKNKTQKNNK
jgi:hypothetical protein